MDFGGIKSGFRWVSVVSNRVFRGLKSGFRWVSEMRRIFKLGFRWISEVPCQIDFGGWFFESGVWKSKLKSSRNAAATINRQFQNWQTRGATDHSWFAKFWEHHTFSICFSEFPHFGDISDDFHGFQRISYGFHRISWISEDFRWFSDGFSFKIYQKSVINRRKWW